jgi:ankyrin repeat protein
MNNDIDEVKRLLEAGADVNAPDEDGDTALMWAVFKGHKDVVKVLYAAGANPKMLDSKGKEKLRILINAVNVPPPRQAW